MATKDDIKQLKAVIDGIAEQVAKNAENITTLLFYHEKTSEKFDLVDKRQNTQDSILSVLSKRTLHHEEELIRLGQ